MSVKQQKPFRIGTRGSKLALKQTDMVAKALSAAHPGLAAEIVVIKTSGDWTPADGETRLPDSAGGKALFAKEIEEALLRGDIDAGVHSLKDMQAVLPDGLAINHVLPRANPLDALILKDTARKIETLHDLPLNARIGTCSVRRQAFLLQRRPDLQIETLRGNVTTRLEKLRSRDLDAIILACAGLERLGLSHEISCTLPPQDMLPAVGQGIIAIETRADDHKTHALLDPLNDRQTLICAIAERAAVAALNGSCHSPIGAYAAWRDDVLHMDLCAASLDGKDFFTQQATLAGASPQTAQDFGFDLGKKLKTVLPDHILR